MLVSPIQINGVQSISVSLGWCGFESWGGMMVHNKSLTVLCGVVLVNPGSRPPVLNWGGKVPHMNRKPKQDLWILGSGDCQALPLSLANALSFLLCVKFRYAILPFPFGTFFSLISFYLVLLLLTPSHSCTHPLTSEINRPIGGQYAEVDSALLLIPPLEWITKWK